MSAPQEAQALHAGFASAAAMHGGQEWALDFVHNAIAAVRTIRVVSIVDDWKLILSPY